MWIVIAPSKFCITLLPFQALVQKGDKRQLFSETMPATIQRSVNEENLQFMQHRDVYCAEYFEFVHRLAGCNMVSYVCTCSIHGRSKPTLYSCVRAWFVICGLPSLCIRNWIVVNFLTQVRSKQFLSAFYKYVFYCAKDVIQSSPNSQESTLFGVCSLQLAINFLFHTYLKTKKKLRYWSDVVWHTCIGYTTRCGPRCIKPRIYRYTMVKMQFTIGQSDHLMVLLH